MIHELRDVLTWIRSELLELHEGMIRVTGESPAALLEPEEDHLAAFRSIGRIASSSGEPLTVTIR